MDFFNRQAVKDYSAWDLNCPMVKKDKKLERKIRRATRRKLKELLKKENDYDVKGNV